MVEIFIDSKNSINCSPRMVQHIDGAYITALPNITEGCLLTLQPISSGADGFIINVDKPFSIDERLVITNLVNNNTVVLDRNNAYCIVTDQTIQLNYERKLNYKYHTNYNYYTRTTWNKISSPSFAIIVTQHICYQSSGLWTKLCKLGSCQLLTTSHCAGAAVSSDMNCDGYYSCPGHEDENTCVLKTISTVAFIGSLLFLLLGCSIGLSVVIFKRFSRQRRRGRVHTSVSYNVENHEINARQTNNLPPSYTDVSSHTDVPNAIPYGHSDIIYMEDLPKYEMVANSNDAPPSAIEVQNESPSNTN
ncbi:hypothetical protein GJ496_003161 [Pomphorhynchus laevis]|nr:hypothetical protein GJ496_003161 [Pomphorhynchus laevis]